MIMSWKEEEDLKEFVLEIRVEFRLLMKSFSVEMACLLGIQNKIQAVCLENI